MHGLLPSLLLAQQLALHQAAGAVVIGGLTSSSSSAPASAAGGGATLGWTQSYTAGYKDLNGQWCGGSEVMHIKPHKGKLFAFNGYWEDPRYTPASTPYNSSSAQVLRLDSANGSWVVDLDTGAGGVAHMKGNIMHSVVFRTDSTGKLLPQPMTLLVAASFAGQGQPSATPAISVWVRDDTGAPGVWTQTTLLAGSSGGRRVPRDIEVHRDSVTGVDRIFLLCGDSGVISGVLSTTTMGTGTGAAPAPPFIEWDTAPEFPIGSPNKTFPVRALGMTASNGQLFFSVGGQLYRRIDGVNPSWSLAWQIPGKVNTEVGGIRGLSTVPTPATSRSTSNGGEESLLFVWTPNGNSEGLIFRLDGPSLANRTEATLRQLYDSHAKQAAGGAKLGTSKSSLGGYNKIFPVTDPASGQLLHLVGFEQSLIGADPSLLWNQYYGGACYAVRRPQTTARHDVEVEYAYDTHEVNDLYSHGKPVLEAPRAFAMSPFAGEEHVLYVGGFDANFHPSENMAWIFKAGLRTVLHA